MKAARGTLCLALENFAVGGKSKSGTTTITSKTAINSKPTTLAKRFIVTTRDNFMFRGMSFVKYREAGQLGLLGSLAATYALRYRRQYRSGTSAGSSVAAISL
ncbi:MAG TPA: hypothetical protein VE604_09940 [Candidatus Polarisedimenticolia bacterium]|nr:hypothetical protein [Candidatus Polarisedimenticolia bacterium]